MGIDNTGLMRFRTADNHTILAALNYMQEKIRIRLGVRRLAAVALRVGHRPVHGQVILLAVDHKLFESLMIICAVLFVDFIGGRKLSIKSIHSNAALEAGCRLLTAESLHFNLIAEIIGILMNVCKAVHDFSCVRGNGCHQLCILRILRQIISHAHRIERRPENRVVNRIFHFFSEHVDFRMHLADALNILLTCHKCHDIYLLYENHFLLLLYKAET